VVSTAFIRDFLIGEADIASFSCYSKPPASAGGAFTMVVIGDLFLDALFQSGLTRGKHASGGLFVVCGRMLHDHTCIHVQNVKGILESTSYIPAIHLQRKRMSGNASGWLLFLPSDDETSRRKA
jgi:hypothetical protein